MAKSMKEKFGKDDIRLARIAKALAHPARIAIMRHLALVNECCFSDISRTLPLADSTVSQHMSELKTAGLVLGTFDPPKIKYSINTEEWKQARKLLKGFAKIKPGKESDELS